MKKMRSVAALVAVSLGVAGLAACAPTRPTLEQVKSTVGDAVRVIPGVEDALVSVWQEGMAGYGVKVRIYVTDPSDIEGVVDDTLESAWLSSPIEPQGVGVSVVPAPMPEGATFVDDPNSIDLRPLAETLRRDKGGTDIDAEPVGTLLVVSPGVLNDWYGPREHTDE